MQPITEAEAIQIAKNYIVQLASETNDCFGLLPEETVNVGKGWIFFYNSCDFISSRDYIDALAGNGPLFISHDRKVYELPSGIPWEKSLSDIKDV